jgi:uncharacterized damage-inducible protein DinB
MAAHEVVGRIERSWHELDGVVRGLDDEGLSLHRAPDGWAVKDHIVHIAAWEHWLLALFEGRDKLVAMGAPEANRQIDDINAMVYENHRDDSARAALDYFRAAHEQLMAHLRKLTAEDFERPYKTFFPPGSEPDEQPVLVAVAGNTYDHYDEHLTWIREQLQGTPAPD